MAQDDRRPDRYERRDERDPRRDDRHDYRNEPRNDQRSDRYAERDDRYDRYDPRDDRNDQRIDRYERSDRYLTEQPASRTRFYRDKRRGKIMGVCAGIADYTGFDANLVRVCMIAAVFMSGGGVVPFYFIAGFVTPTKPRELDMVDREERQFWQGVRASPTRTARDIRSRFKDIDRRLADIESYVTTENRSLAREIDALALEERTEGQK
jgi:phage shock protein C